MTLSRIAAAVSLLSFTAAAAAVAQTTAEDVVATADAAYAFTDDECASEGRTIVVCADVNENDRYRLPFETAIPGDPDKEGVWAERERIQAAPGTCERGAYYQVGCGAVGIGIGIGGGNPGLRTGGLRRAGQ